VRLVEEAVTDIAQSISDLGIRSAVCAPLTLGDAVIGVVYLDARMGEGAALPEALGFCDALARLTALSLGEIKRAELHKRQLQLEADLAAAQIAQRFLGPAATGRIGPVTYATRTFPGRLVAGDLFDIFPLPGGRAGICVGDVTGQGFAAGIVMTAVLSHLRASLARDADPADAVALANTYLTERSDTGVFTTLFAAVLETDGTLHFADAGHGHWILVRADGSVARGPLPDGLVIGVDRAATYAARTLQLAPGDRVVLYSDGMVEHMGVDSQEFGFDRLAGSLEGSGGPQEDVDRAFGALEAFLDGRPLSDDTTIASLRYEGELGGP
jgi:sigma-B regulation protein RsbU (phosphoserine phosphatase)